MEVQGDPLTRPELNDFDDEEVFIQNSNVDVMILKNDFSSYPFYTKFK